MQAQDHLPIGPGNVPITVETPKRKPASRDYALAVVFGLGAPLALGIAFVLLFDLLAVMLGTAANAEITAPVGMGLGAVVGGLLAFRYGWQTAQKA